MGIMIKHSFRNIISKPLRLIVLVVCILMASFAALLAFDMGNNVEAILRGYTAQTMGNMNLCAIGAKEEELRGVEELTDMCYVGISTGNNYITTHDTTDYNYILTDTVVLYSFSSLENAVELRLISGDISIDDQSVVVSPQYAEKYGKEVGDTVTLYTYDNGVIELTISSIYEVDSEVFSKEAVLMSEYNLSRIKCRGNNEHTIWFFNVKDTSKIKEVSDFIRHNAPKANVIDLYEVGEDSGIEEYKSLFSLLFLVTLLLVLFVTISLSEKIVNERMSVIGTLRSLGVKSRNTAFILLIENALYAIIGSVLGVITYLIFKEPLVSSVLFFDDNDGNPLDLSRYYNKTPLYLLIAVVIGSILLECAYPLYELLKAVKTPIRDIIFNNKDTEFKYTWRRLYLGGGLVLISAVSSFMVKNFAIVSISIASGVIALGVLLPFAIRWITRGMAAMFKKMPVARLAAENISRNKSIMGNSILTVIAVLLCVLVIAICGPVWKWLAPSSLPYDVRANIEYVDGVDYSYFGNIDGINEMDIEYRCGSYAAISPVGSNEEVEGVILAICADTSHTLSDYLPHEAYGLAEDEMVISKKIAQKYGIEEGDEVKLIIHSDSDFPTELILTIVDIYDPYEISGVGVPRSTKVVIIDPDLYDHLFRGYMNSILFTSDDPDALKKEISDCTDPSNVEVVTASEMILKDRTDAQGLGSVLSAIVIGSTVLTFTGIAGNQTFAFITRKREIALIYSVAMGRKKIRRLLLLESLFSVCLSVIIALISAPLFYISASHLIDLLCYDGVDILNLKLVDPGPVACFIIAISVLYILTVIGPFRALKKMNISEELKYE